ncbi:(deoxy)nucleoside triphosphate pyrophosphohydrolase [Oceanivirga salmonicida]|uniref:(deoxy)nucleoside triphosphate pyrophosphohydrolase n=1 Tax=Oceanivirga salmonicida TaxID=1769291 RepID=UPI0012E1CC0D|nr:(deoxy)nucleoside triphosphate pyrophosphohydrolase [Oceanivirga salmonicida]
MKRIEVVAAAIIKNGNILITKRKKGEFKNMWEFPGGKIEIGETREEALIREINEELSIDIEIEKYVNTINYSYKAFDLIMHIYICSIKSGNIKLIDHDQYMWATKNDLDNIKWIPADVLVLEDLKKNII